MKLRGYQGDALHAVCGAFFEHGMNRVLMQQSTGLGKTVTFAAMPQWPAIADWLKQFPPRERGMLVIAHREELLTQAADKIHRANPDLMISIEQGENRAHGMSDVIIASIQTLAARDYRRLERLMARNTFRIVVCDEAHHAAARTYRGVFARLGFLPMEVAAVGETAEAVDFDDVEKMTAALQAWDKEAPKDRLLLGVTATPNRSDAIGLGCVFQTIAYTYPLKKAIDDKWLVPIIPWAVETTESLDGVQISHGDYNQRQLGEVVNTKRRNLLAVKAWLDYAEGRSTLAFSVNVEHAHALEEAFNEAGVKAKAISGETPKDERREALAAYTRGEITVLANCMVLTEGTDLPRTSCILHAKPTKSATLHEQMTGRGLRLYDGKADCIVIDMVDISRRHSLMTAPALFGLPPSLLAKGDDLNKMAEEIEKFREEYPGFDIEGAGRVTLADLRVKAQTFDIWKVPSLGAFGTGRALNWIKAGDEDYRLQYPWGDGTEVLRVARDLLGHYDISLTLRPREGGPARQRTLATDLKTADEAAAEAERFVLNERRSVTKLKDRDAPWRVRPASEKQIQYLYKLRIPVRKGLTMGEASDLIDLHRARKHA